MNSSERPSPLVEAMATRWSTVTKRDRAGRPITSELSPTCDQEPCYEELFLQKIRGVACEKLREQALALRKEMNGGFHQLSPDMVRRAVAEAIVAVDDYRSQFPPIEGTEFLAMLGRAPK